MTKQKTRGGLAANLICRHFTWVCTMSKRKVQFADKDGEEIQGESSLGRVKAHSLDSDEEGDDDDGVKDDEKYVLREEDLEGQEDATIDFDEGIKITPFNLKEEMEEGHFDAEGNYFEKKEEVIRDEWLDSLDWVKIKERGDQFRKYISDDESKFEDADEPADQINKMKQILGIILPGETILKALRRLGGKESGRGKSSSASARWQLKAKKQKATEDDSEHPASEEDKQTLLKLTELADYLLQTGNFSIYQDTYEKLAHKVKSMEENLKEADEDDALEAAFRQGGGEGEKTVMETESSDNAKTETANEDEVYWQYKWENTKNATVYGPYSSTYMLIWNQQGCFGDGVWVRKVGEDEGPFYNSKRIDFELYT